MAGMFIAAYEAMVPVPGGGIFPNNAASSVPSGNGSFSPQGTVYNVLAKFPSFRPSLNDGEVPAPSNFGSVVFPQKLWDKTANYGDNMGVYQGPDRSGGGTPSASSGRRG